MVSLPVIFNSMGLVMKEVQINEILSTNEESQKYGLVLTFEEAEEIIEARSSVLQSYGRIELGTGPTGKLISSFCSSAFIEQEEYAATMKDLQEVFYYMKNETEDSMGDDELIEVIKDFFENTCRGSIELLKGRELETFSKECRHRNGAGTNFMKGEI